MCDNENKIVISLKDISKYYNKDKFIFKNLNLKISLGTVFGLLGPSGCGKTTIINCIVGIEQLTSGQIYIFNRDQTKIDDNNIKYQIGFMPQTVSLNSRFFTVHDAFYYFGTLFNMNMKQINERFIFLTKLLALPGADRYIECCSGGEQRRISLAIALLHEPKLLILDEPTVGLDPVMRHNIWNYLIDLSENKSVAILFTTHYLEEAKNSTQIGLMRKGRIVYDGPPNTLLNHFQTETLEQAFFYLINDTESFTSIRSNLTTLSANFCIDISNTRTMSYLQKLSRLKALINKSIKQVYRNYSQCAFIFLFPILMTLAMFMGCGMDPKQLGLAVVNDEIEWYQCQLTNNFVDKQQFLSCHFLNLIDNNKIIKVHKNNIGNAKESVRNGETMGAVYFKPNFTESLLIRIENQMNTNSIDIDNSEITVFLDMSNYVTSNYIKQELYTIFINFMEDILKQQNDSIKLANIPIKMNHLYQSTSNPFQNSLNSAGLIVAAYFTANILSCFLILEDRSDGIWQRTLVAGVQHSEILLAHTCTQLFVTIIQILIQFFISFIVLQMDCFGNIFLAFLLVLTQAIAGTSMGLLISIICESVTIGLLIVITILFTISLGCGGFWPLEGMPRWFYYLSLCNPPTIPVAGLRSILLRGWTIFNTEVLLAFVVTILWICFLNILNFIFIKKVKK